MKCIKYKDLVCGLGVNFGTDCDKQICKMNAILRRHYTNLVGTNVTKCAIGFSAGGHMELETHNGNDIYKVLGVYVELNDECQIGDCYQKVADCGCECDNTYRLAVSEAYRELSVGEYSVNGNKICINVGENVTRGYIVYNRGPKEIESIDDEICLEPLEMELLQMGILRYQAEIDKNFELASYFEKQMYNQKTKIMNDIEDRIPFSIKGFK